MAVKRWGDFEIDFSALLGRGGMGAVYKGRQVSLDRPAAVKILKKELTENPDFVKRFHREAALLARLVDTHVVQVFGAGEAEGQHFYAMEYVEGDDYSGLIKQGRKFTLEEVLQVGLSVGTALHAAWKQKIIHRDIKPSNILKTRDGEIKVMDFGLAKNPETDLTQSEMIMGTAKYMSPEQATGQPCDVRSDLYSLGVVLFELAAGKPPFVGDTPTAMMYQQVHHPPPKPRSINPGISVEMEAMILRLLEKKPEARYASPEALLSTIRAIQDGVTPDEKSTLFNETVMVGSGPAYAPTVKLPATTREQAPAAPKSRGGLWAAVAVAVMAAAGGGAYHFKTQTPPATTVSTPTAPPEPKPPAPEPAKPASPAAPPWEESRKKGLEAFGSRQWVMAYTLLDEAERQGAKDVTDQKVQARANEHLEKGEAEPDEETALQHFEAARKIRDDEETRQRIRSTSFRRWRKSAEKGEGGDWARAAEDWRRAAEYAEAGQSEEVRDRQRFCARFAEAVAARTTKDWKKALEAYSELAKAPRGFAVAIELEIKRAETELAKAAEMAAVELRKELDGILEQGRKSLKRAAWVEAKALYERAREPRFKDFPRDETDRALAELAAALSAPKGMVYVPAGRFTMGGGSQPEAPEGEAETGAYYLDERETSVGAYAEFLKGLDSFGHHAGCLKTEAPNKNHVPDDWEGQQRDSAAPVVGVDWWDAASYAAWRKLRLPREVEWEKAAAFDPAGGRRSYAWGPKYQKEGGRSYLGLEGMGTGVMEWTGDWFRKYAWGRDEHSDFGEKKRVLRGGVLLLEDAEEKSKASFRQWNLPTYRSRKVGFRCAMDIETR
jgi:serine/threonine protein kinase/formylglycine-generating enzyme required for sulfatase activity